MVTFRNRGSLSPALPTAQETSVVALRPDTYEQAREYATGWDVYISNVSEGNGSRNRRAMRTQRLWGFARNGTKSVVRHDMGNAVGRRNRDEAIKD